MIRKSILAALVLLPAFSQGAELHCDLMKDNEQSYYLFTLNIGADRVTVTDGISGFAGLDFSDGLPIRRNDKAGIVASNYQIPDSGYSTNLKLNRRTLKLFVFDEIANKEHFYSGQCSVAEPRF